MMMICPEIPSRALLIQFSWNFCSISFLLHQCNDDIEKRFNQASDDEDAADDVEVAEVIEVMASDHEIGRLGSFSRRFILNFVKTISFNKLI